MEIIGKGKVKSILLIDDDRDDFDLVTEAINVIDPAISVSFLPRCEKTKKFEKLHFDFILLDINMPRHDGFEWLNGIRKRGNQIPVVMYTNSSNTVHIKRAYEEGANLYFVKPDNFKTMVSCFQKLISMDWANPAAITGNYFFKDKFLTFQVD